MKKSEIKVGGLYETKTNGQITTVRVEKIEAADGQKITRDCYHVIDVSSGLKDVFCSPIKFLREVKTNSEKLAEARAELKEFTEGVTAEVKAIPAPLRKLSNYKPAPSADNAPHLIIEARAGTGKTTTLVEGLKVMMGGSSKLIPSPQQAKVWEAMKLSAGKVKSICFVAFNKSIATELQARVPAGVNASTMHSMGFKAVRESFGNVRVNEYRVSDLISEITGRDIRELRKFDNDMVKGTQDLVGLCKMNLCNGTEEEMEQLVSHYGLELNGSKSKVFKLVPQVLERCKDVKKDNAIDYDDMIWIPVACDLKVTRYDVLLVDEAQDLNRCQQALAKKAGRRLILCGDPKQAIYGFAGADSESMKRMAEELGAPCTRCFGGPCDPNCPEKPRGCTVLPLTVTRRCGRAIVREANKIVGDFHAHETNCEGRVVETTFPEYFKIASEGDMVLCRVNAPLVSQCFRFLKAGRKANIQGRDVGQGLISTVKKMKVTTVVDLASSLSDWLHAETQKELAKRNPVESRLIALQDRYDCLMCFTEGLSTTDQVIAKIESIFTDDKKSPGIKLSSVHKAKGLESKRVFILMPKGSGMPHPMAKGKWQIEQEYNLKYVAITRAIEELYWVNAAEDKE